mgnify:CR=1 FL=1
MSKTYDWLVYIEDSAGNWQSEDSFPRPNEDLELIKTSNTQITKLVDGSKATVTPETKSSQGAFSMFWADSTSDFRAQLDGYIDNGDTIKIIAHTGEEFIGIVYEYHRVWLTGLSPDVMDIQVSFQPLE